MERRACMLWVSAGLGRDREQHGQTTWIGSEAGLGFRLRKSAPHARCHGLIVFTHYLCDLHCCGARSELACEGLFVA
jgi:hypothetical protein